MREYGFAIFLGALGGAAVAGGIWMYASRALDTQLAAGGSQLSVGIQEGRHVLEARLREGEVELQNQIRVAVRTAMDQRLAEAGITRDTGTRIDAVLQLAHSAGLI